MRILLLLLWWWIRLADTVLYDTQRMCMCMCIVLSTHSKQLAKQHSTAIDNNNNNMAEYYYYTRTSYV